MGREVDCLKQQSGRGYSSLSTYLLQFLLEVEKEEQDKSKGREIAKTFESGRTRGWHHGGEGTYSMLPWGLGVLGLDLGSWDALTMVQSASCTLLLYPNFCNSAGIWNHLWQRVCWYNAIIMYHVPVHEIHFQSHERRSIIVFLVGWKLKTQLFCHS